MDSGELINQDQGVVVKRNIGIYYVRVDGCVLPCSLSSRLCKQLIYTSANQNSRSRRVRYLEVLHKVDPLAVGDVVRYVGFHDGSGMIVEVLPRRNRLARRDPAPRNHNFEQVIVTNVDYIIPVFASARPTLKWGLLDRYLVAAESLELSALIVVTKLNLVRGSDGRLDEEIGLEMEEYRRIGYPVLLTSSVTQACG